MRRAQPGSFRIATVGYPRSGHAGRPFHSVRTHRRFPVLRPALRVWILGRILALGALMGTSGLLYHAATSPAFQLAHVRVSGNHVLSAGELEAALVTPGTGTMLLQRADALQRLEALPSVASADVDVILPNLIDVRVTERVATAIWRSGNTSYLIDSNGVVFGQATGREALPLINDVDSSGLQVGSRLDPRVIDGALTLSRAIRDSAGLTTSTIMFSRQSGLDLSMADGLTVRFGDGEDLDWKLEAYTRIRQYLTSQRMSAQFIDVRFRDRPYFR